MAVVKRRSFLKSVSAVTAASAFGLGYSNVIFARRADFRLKFANNLPVSHPMNIRAKEMVEAIKKDTDGAVDIRVYPSSQLGNDTDTLSQIRAGAVDFFTLSPIIMGTLISKTQISGVGFGFKDYDQVWKAMDGELGAAVREEIEKSSNLTAFDKIWDNGFRIITTSSKPINVPDDLNSMKLRVPPSPLWTSMFKGLGASPTTINFAETYSALQTHIADGQENPITLVETAKLYEVQKYASLTNHMWDGFWFLANRDNLAKVPKDMQEIIRKHVMNASLSERDDLAKLSLTVKQTLEGKGMAFNEVDTNAFRGKLKQAGFYEEWKKTFGDELWGKLEKFTGALS